MAFLSTRIVSFQAPCAIYIIACLQLNFLPRAVFPTAYSTTKTLPMPQSLGVSEHSNGILILKLHQNTIIEIYLTPKALTI